MIDMEAKQTSDTRVIAAPADVIFEILADPARHCEFDGSDTVQASKLQAPDRLSLGAKFGMKMKFLGVPYQISSVVKEFEEDQRIAWAHFGKHRWRYELEPVEGGTRVTETFDWSTAMWPKGIELAGYPKSHEPNITRTLERLEEVALADVAASAS